MVRAEILSLEAMGRFLSAGEEVRFEAADRPQLYQWLEEVLVGQQYASLGKPARGLVRRYIAKITGLSRSQVTRLIALYTASGRVAELDRPAQYRRRGHRRHRRGQAHAASQGHAVRKAAAHRVEPVAKQEGPRRWRMKQQSLAMHQTRKGNQWFFGLKTHIGVDAKEGHVHSVATMAANVSD